MKKLILGQNLSLLANVLSSELEQRKRFPFNFQKILVPDRYLRSWLQLHLCQIGKERALFGCKILTISEWTKNFSPSYLELFLSIHQELFRIEDEQLQRYLEERKFLDSSAKLAKHLTDLFFRYWEFSFPFFIPNREKQEHLTAMDEIN